jgi:hypothetical protein
MTIVTERTMNRILAAAGIAVIAVPATAADPATIDWTKVPSTAVTLFYPGQSSYEWLRKDHRKGKGAKATADGQACVRCHDGDEKAMGAAIVQGGPLEPTPVKGKQGHIDLKVQAAYDERNAYLRFQWRTNAGRAGTAYPSYRFDGKEWKAYGGPKLDQEVREGKEPGVYEDRLSIMLDDGKVPGFARQGCWLTCHNGSRDMPGSATKGEAQAAIKKDDVRKYLPASRTDPADWRSVKPAAELAAIKAAGGFADLMQWRAHRSNPAGAADDGYVLEFRNFDSGRNHFASNFDRKAGQPRFMFEAGKKGDFLVNGVNAVPFAADAGWKQGDMLPEYFLQPAAASGSAADNKAMGTWQAGEWTVLIVRPLGLANEDDKTLREGGVYNVGFAVHDDNITTRGHHVSFVRTLGIGAAGDIRAVKLP